MKLKILEEAGFRHALLGISLSYNRPFETEDDINKVYETAKKLAHKEGGHNKFLESISVWLDIVAPRYWWQQFATYRIGITCNSESTMHTIMKRQLSEDDFENPLPDIIDFINEYINEKDFETVKSNLPEGFLQRRIIALNYKVLRHMILQRKNHKLKEWRYFISEIYKQIEHPEFLSELEK